MMFFKRRRSRYISRPISGYGERPAGSRPTPEQLMAARETYVVKRTSLDDRRAAQETLHALEARVADLERDLIMGLNATSSLISHVLGIARGRGGFHADQINEWHRCIWEIIDRLEARQP